MVFLSMKMDPGMKVIGKMVSFMAKVLFIIMKVTYMMVNLILEKLMGTGFIKVKMELCLVVSLVLVKSMGLELILSKVERLRWENGTTGKEFSGYLGNDNYYNKFFMNFIILNIFE